MLQTILDSFDIESRKEVFCGILGGIPEGFLIYDSITKSLWFFDIFYVEMAQFDL